MYAPFEKQSIINVIHVKLIMKTMPKEWLQLSSLQLIRNLSRLIKQTANSL